MVESTSFRDFSSIERHPEVRKGGRYLALFFFFCVNDGSHHFLTSVYGSSVSSDLHGSFI